jgi:hypothetical protein
MGAFAATVAARAPLLQLPCSVPKSLWEPRLAAIGLLVAARALLLRELLNHLAELFR